MIPANVQIRVIATEQNPKGSFSPYDGYHTLAHSQHLALQFQK